MMATINPLGERARGNRWWRTAAAFAAGSLAGGWALGAAAGLAGLGLRAVASQPGEAVAMAAATGLVLVAGLAELAAWPVPTRRRQVDEAWLDRYRGWVYGGGFGVQLGVGLATTVTPATVYALAASALLLGWTGEPGWAQAVGGLFGLARAAPVLAAARLDDPDRLRRRAARVSAAAGASRLAAGSSLCGLAALAVVVA